MVSGEDLSNGSLPEEHSAKTDISQHKKFELLNENPDLPKRFVGFTCNSDSDQVPALKFENSDSRELTLKYLCNNIKVGNEILERNQSNSFDKENCKMKELVSENLIQELFVERDFLNLNEVREDCIKREVCEDIMMESREKKPKLGTLNLSLALPDVSLSLASSNPVHDGNLHNLASHGQGLQLLGQANSNSQTIYSDDFTAASLSYSYSHPFSHNPSCSLTGKSTENCEFSAGCGRREDKIWHCGEGTNGSVHSRFKPIGGGVHLSDRGGSNYPLMRCNSLQRTAGFDSHSFFPSELPARPRFGTHSVDSRARTSRHIRGFDGGRIHHMTSKQQRILHEIVSEPIPVIAQMIQELPEKVLQLTQEYLSRLLAPEKKEELAGLQERLCQRSDLSIGTLSKADKRQLEILVGIKTGLPNFLLGKNSLSKAELAEILLSLRCRNVDCRSLLPVDDCDCKICSENKGFCRECMCPVCMKFDCANNTCSWVGCDVCSHWCHASCGIQQKLIKPGPSLKGPAGTTEMQFHCNGCGHASEMFGFVKDVFLCCAKNWDLETVIKELDCVSRIFKGSDDFKGRELEMKAKEMLLNLESKVMSSSDACYSITQFFDSIDDTHPIPLPSPSHRPKYNTYKTNSSSIQCEVLPANLHVAKGLNPSISNGRTSPEDGALLSNGFDSLESIVRIKELEARMFQTRADKARREAESCMQMIREKTKKMEEEYTERLAKLCIQESEERRRKKVDELNVLENSRCDYYNMKMRMQAEIAGLLERMEATKQYWV